MMSKIKGFTLVELLAVIVILGIVLSVSIVSVNSIRKKQEKENRENVIGSILTGAKSYVADNNLDVPTSFKVEILQDNYVKKKKKEYDFKNKIVNISTCKNNDLKLEYSINIDNNIYTDCGCELQEEGNSSKNMHKKITNLFKLVIFL